MSRDLRYPETEKRYRDLIATGILERCCVLCDKEAISSFTHWKIITNDFPYDRIAKTHDMLVPLRHVIEGSLTDEEHQELLDIKHGYVNDHYDYIIEPTHHGKSIPTHLHSQLTYIGIC